MPKRRIALDEFLALWTSLPDTEVPTGTDVVCAGVSEVPFSYRKYLRLFGSGCWEGVLSDGDRTQELILGASTSPNQYFTLDHVRELYAIFSASFTPENYDDDFVEAVEPLVPFGLCAGAERFFCWDTSRSKEGEFRIVSIDVNEQIRDLGKTADDLVSALLSNRLLSDECEAFEFWSARQE